MERHSGNYDEYLEKIKSSRQKPRTFILLLGAEGGSRTRTRGKPRWILSPVRLPVPPLRHETENKYNYIKNAYPCQDDRAANSVVIIINFPDKPIIIFGYIHEGEEII